jgi:hypothetical protein
VHSPWNFQGRGALTLNFKGRGTLTLEFPEETRGYINLKISRKGSIQTLEFQGEE